MEVSAKKVLLILPLIKITLKIIMFYLNYYAHLFLTGKYSFIIKISFSFLIYILLLLTTNTFNLTECTIEHPNHIQNTVPITQFAAPRSVSSVGQLSAPVFNIALIQTPADLLRALSIPNSTLNLYTTQSLIAWEESLHVDFIIHYPHHNPINWPSTRTYDFPWVEVNNRDFLRTQRRDIISLDPTVLDYASIDFYYEDSVNRVAKIIKLRTE